jgi:hypothetical protein
LHHIDTNIGTTGNPLARCLIGKAHWSDIVEATDAPLNGNAVSLQAEAICPHGRHRHRSSVTVNARL